jgi:hypothetical protein
MAILIGMGSLLFFVPVIRSGMEETSQSVRDSEDTAYHQTRGLKNPPTRRGSLLRRGFPQSGTHPKLMDDWCAGVGCDRVTAAKRDPNFT